MFENSFNSIMKSVSMLPLDIQEIIFKKYLDLQKNYYVDLYKSDFIKKHKLKYKSVLKEIDLSEIRKYGFDFTYYDYKKESVEEKILENKIYNLIKEESKICYNYYKKNNIYNNLYLASTYSFLNQFK